MHYGMELINLWFCVKEVLAVLIAALSVYIIGSGVSCRFLDNTPVSPYRLGQFSGVKHFCSILWPVKDS